MKVKVSNKKRGWFFAFVILFLFFASFSFSRAGTGASWISLNPAPDRIPRVSVLSSDFDQVIFEIQIPGLWSEAVATQGGDFALLSIPQEGVSNVVGEPNLPVITRMVQIPFGAEVSLSWESPQEIEKSLEELGVARRIVPVQPPIPKIEGAWQKAKFVIDEEYYQQNTFLPEERVKLGETGIIRGHRWVSLSIYPVSYNPFAGKVRIYPRIRVKLSFSGTDMTTTQNQLRRYTSPPFEKLCQKLFINYPTYEPIVKGAPQLPVGYLIITHQNFYYSVLGLVDWKTRKGFHVTVAQVPDIGSTRDAIKSYIQNAYTTWEIPPTYVLFVGDTEYIPTWTGSYSGTATDLYYVKMDGDAFADIFRGRLPAKSSTEADAMVSKILYYENPTSTDLEWMRRACFIAASDLNGLAERTHDYVMLNYLLPNGMICDTIWERLGGTGAMITASVNDGRSILCYSGHGYEYGWASVSYGQSDVRNLSNADRYPFVLSHACLTGKFDVYESFGETWAKEAGKAGIAFWGASSYTYWDEDDILEKRMFQAAFVETCYAIGDMTDRALYRLYQYYSGGGTSRYYLDVYNIMGDPSVDMWTYVAESLYVDLPPAINPGTNTVIVTVQKSGGLPVYGALVSLYKEGEVFETGYTDEMGEVTLYPSPATLGVLQVTVTAHNFLPFVDSIEVAQKIGDVNHDGEITIADVVFLINYLYKGGPAPDPLEMGDTNCDEVIDVADVVYLTNYLFQDGPPPCF